MVQPNLVPLLIASGSTCTVASWPGVDHVTAARPRPSCFENNLTLEEGSIGGHTTVTGSDCGPYGREVKSVTFVTPVSESTMGAVTTLSPQICTNRCRTSSFLPSSFSPVLR
ncbi:hypothetical protein DPEC_G00149460 [Dallia pectoralis]|uniref:Uncharacterized protein n=1 Tax=Dallia pectoralis TaxID=75939 RepID=A0ACC2GJ84_DALPE|nr:hypothetical protein DPEC_G00149460 [Dallia pectoralis]